MLDPITRQTRSLPFTTGMTKIERLTGKHDLMASRAQRANRQRYEPGSHSLT